MITTTRLRGSDMLSSERFHPAGYSLEADASSHVVHHPPRKRDREREQQRGRERDRKEERKRTSSL